MFLALGFVPQSIGLNIAELVYKKSVTTPSERKEIAFLPEALTQFIGSYTITPVNIYYKTQTSTLVIYLENDHLAAQIESHSKVKLFPESETKFFSKIPDVQIEFFKDKQGNVSHLVLHQDGEESTGMKIL